MGLDCSHDAFSGAYSSFNRLRVAAAKAMGGSFPEKPFGGDQNWYWGDGYSQDTHPGLYEFFMHSDCDGEIAPESCKMVADELEELLQKIVEDEGSGGHLARDHGYRGTIERFIAGCRKAHAAGEPLVFS